MLQDQFNRTCFVELIGNKEISMSSKDMIHHRYSKVLLTVLLLHQIVFWIGCGQVEEGEPVALLNLNRPRLSVLLLRRAKSQARLNPKNPKSISLSQRLPANSSCSLFPGLSNRSSPTCLERVFTMRRFLTT